MYFDADPFSTGSDAIPTWLGTLAANGGGSAGLLYRRNRYYDPSTGQFTQQDPIGLAGGMNLYGFAGGDPVSYSDPFGLCPCSFDDITRETARRLRHAQKPLEFAGMVVTAPLAGGMGMLGGMSAGVLELGGEAEPVSYGLVWLSSVLREIGKPQK